MFRSIILINILALSLLSTNACEIESLNKQLGFRFISIKGKLKKDISCHSIQTRIHKLMNEEQESLSIQKQIQDLYYLDENLISIQIQYVEINQRAVGQIQVYSF